jgi:hypothetical protein
MGTPAYAQKADEGKSSPPQAQSGPQSSQQGDQGGMKGGEQKKAQESQKGSKASNGKSAQTGAQDKGSQSSQAEPRDKGKASGQSEMKKSSKQAEPKDKGKAAAQSESKEKAAKQTSKDSAGKSTAQGESKDRSSTKGASQTPSKDAASKTQKSEATDKSGAQSKGAAATSKSGGQRVQLSEEQRTNFRQALQKDQRINRVNTVNFSISVGTRVPRSVRLAVLPAAVISIVPAYRSYRYFVVRDEICIVDPATYEIVEVVDLPAQTAGSSHGSNAQLVLTDEERTFLIHEVDVSGGSTLGLGSFSVGADVPRNVELRMFPDKVVERIGKLKGHKFFTAENRIVIVDTQGQKVDLVVDDRR